MILIIGAYQVDVQRRQTAPRPRAQRAIGTQPAPRERRSDLQTHAARVQTLIQLERVRRSFG